LYWGSTATQDGSFAFVYVCMYIYVCMYVNIYICMYNMYIYIYVYKI
jgi:hypothetical protein